MTPATEADDPVNTVHSVTVIHRPGRRPYRLRVEALVGVDGLVSSMVSRGGPTGDAWFAVPMHKLSPRELAIYGDVIRKARPAPLTDRAPARGSTLSPYHS